MTKAAKKHLEPVHDEAAAPAAEAPRIITHAIINLGDALRAVHQFVPNGSVLDRTEASVSVRDDGLVTVDVLTEA
jgi:hypothetical protein